MFISLHNHTQYSILDSLVTPLDLIKRAKELGQHSIAITDHGSIASAFEAYKASKVHGIKLIIGLEANIKLNINDPEEKFKHIILLATNAIGYKNLLTINKLGFDLYKHNGKKAYSVIDFHVLENYSEGLICLTSCGSGIIAQSFMNKNPQEAEELAIKLQTIFKNNLGLEVQANNLKRFKTAFNEEVDQNFVNRQIINLAKKLNIRIVPTCNTHYLLKEQHEIHDALLAIGCHQDIYSNYRLKYTVPDFYLKNTDEMISFFSRNYGEEFAHQIIENTEYFASLCEEPKWIDLQYSNPSGKELPSFPVKDQSDYNEYINWLSNQDSSITSQNEDSSYLYYITTKNFEANIASGKIDINKKQEYLDRINQEWTVFNYLGLNSYMLLVADFLNYARNNNIPVGPGRGSVGGSLIAYLLNIHMADSIKYGLVFERFHNKLKKGMSDIDCDIAKSGREKVIDYVRSKYGDDCVAHVSNINTITPKVYSRDISRVCQLGGTKDTAIDIGNKVADSVPVDISSINSALTNSPLFIEYSKKFPELIKYKEIDGCYRAFSTHAAGVIVNSRPLTGLVPLRRDKEGILALEYDKDVAEEAGLVKIDFLGLSTLDIIEKTNELIIKNGKQVPNIDYETYDEKTYNLISSGNTFGIFQFGTSVGTIELCKKIQPKSIEDLSIITTVARPASKDFREDFIKTRDGKRAVLLFHPSLGRAFANTFGFPLYDESLLILAKDVAGWDLDEADKLRKLTKEKGKNPEKVKKWKAEFIEGSVKNGLKEEVASNIWTKIVEPFGKYSFNKSHAVLYSMISFHTAYLKAHFPVEFLLANLMFEISSAAPNAEENIQQIKKELRNIGVNILSPDINKSNLHYELQDNSLLTGLNAIKFVGDDAINDILQKRPFTSFFDFMVRVDSGPVRSNTIQALIASGAFDSFGLNRKSMFLYCSDYRKKLQVWLKKHEHSEFFNYPFPEEPEWSLSEKYALEYKYMGEAFCCKPYQAYANFFKEKHIHLDKILKAEDKTKLEPFRAIIIDFAELTIKKEGKYFGHKMLKVLLEDYKGNNCYGTLFPNDYTNFQIKLQTLKIPFDKGIALCFSGTTNKYNDVMGLIINNIYGVMSPPQEPKDLKHKKISLKETKNKTLNLFESVEDALIYNGLIEEIDE